DWRSNGFSPYSVLCAKTSRVSHDDWHDHRVILRRPIDFRTGLGPGFRSLWAKACTAYWAQWFCCCLYGFRFRQLDLAAVSLPDRTRTWGWHDRGGAGLHQRHRPIGRSSPLTWVVIGRNEPRNNARARCRVVCNLLGAAVAGDFSRIALPNECLICMEV